MDEIELDYHLRPARSADRSYIETLVNAAYAPFIIRLGTPPGPEIDDYVTDIEAGEAQVLESGGSIAGLLVLRPEKDHMLINNIAVDPGFQGRGFANVLLNAAEEEARRRGLKELRLYAHSLMAENHGLYLSHGWEEAERRKERGDDRICFRKRLM